MGLCLFLMLRKNKNVYTYKSYDEGDKKNKQIVGMTKMWDDCKFLWEQACKRFPGEGLFILT